MSNWKGKRVFVTGGAGFIGSHLTAKLVELGADVSLLIHKTVSKTPVSKSLVGDLTQKDQQELTKFLKDNEPEVVFHLAAQPLVSVAGADALETLQTNVAGTYNLLHACKDLPSVKSFVHISTDKVFGNTPTIQDDTALDGTTHPYNGSKVSGDILAQMYSNFFDLPMVVVRNANVYGAGDTHFDRLVPRTIRSVLNNERPVVRGDGSNTRDYIHVSEIVEGYIRAAELPYQNKLTTLNLGGWNYAVIEVIDIVLRMMRRIDLAPTYEQQWKGEIPHQNIVDKRAEELIGWNPNVDIDSGLELTIPWYEENYGKG